MWHTEDLFLWDIAAHKGVQVDDLSPHGTYYNYAYEQENQENNDSVLEIGTENDSVLGLQVTVCLNNNNRVCWLTDV